MSILITGATGFAGCHLVEHLHKKGYPSLHALARHDRWPVGFESVKSLAKLWTCNLTDASHVRHVIAQTKPKQIYHLAGSVDPAQSNRDPSLAWQGNLVSTQVLYSTLVELQIMPRILHVSTGAVYGDVRQTGQVINEQTELRPNTPYATSKAAADLLGYQIYRSHGLPIIRVRPFNFIGPGLPARFALAHFAKQIAAIERGLQKPVLRVGQLSTERDLLDVRDLVEAYVLLMDRGKPGEVYNLAYGQTYPMRWFLDQLLAHCSIPIEVQVDPTLLRPADTATVQVDLSNIRQTTGWQPKYQLAQTVMDVLNYYRSLNVSSMN